MSQSYMKRIHHRSRQGFTLVELLVSMAVLSILMVMVSSVVSEVQRSWGATTAKVSQFREARRAFDIVKINLGQATLNTYVRYRFDNASDPFSPFTASGEEIPNAAPTRYVKFSELQFVSGPTATVLGTAGNSLVTQGHSVFFQAPLGYSTRYTNLPTALNPRGYYVAFGGDATYRPPFLAGRVDEKFRYRLMEYAPPTENNVIYDENSPDQSDWFTNVVTHSRPVADNVITLIISPKRVMNRNEVGDPRDIAPNYQYNSAVLPTADSAQPRNAYELPPEIEVAMVVVDERSADALARTSGMDPPLPTTGFVNATGDNFRADLEALERTLVAAKVNFRVFTATVTMRNSKWGGN